MKGDANRFLSKFPLLVAVAAVAVLVLWWSSRTGEDLRIRVPGTDAAPSGQTVGANPVLAGKLIPGSGQPADLPGDWPQFRGPNRDGISTSTAKLSRDWKTSPPRELWSLDVGEGYAGVAVRSGRVYLLDYDREAKQSALRCLSLADGKEIWRFAYPIVIKRNHGMTRTVPAVTDKFVVAIDSKCNVLCVDATSGELKWTISLVREYGTTVPQWYTGQCPLVDGDKVILAPGGNNALLLAVDLATGKPLWQTPNPRGWKMTHSSVMPMEFAGHRLYVYCASGGVVGVDAKNGAMLFETSDWRISIATVPSPLPLADGRIFLTGGYNAGSLMLQLVANNLDAPTDPQPLQGGQLRQAQEGQSPSGKGPVVGSASKPTSSPLFTCKHVFKLTPEVFGATQHTPILKNGCLYGVRADGRFVCLGLDGKVVWASGPGETYGLGSFLMKDDLIFALNDKAKLSLIEATTVGFNLLGQVQILKKGRESWAPMALVGDRLLARDLTHLVCLDVSAK
jgi:outer membrane protein assembly factor BamB